MSNNLGEQFRDIIQNIRATHRKTHSSVVMVSVSIIAAKLELAIKATMENYGPLNTFAAKIDKAHALGIIPLDMYEELRKIKKLRNEFAHPTDILNFESEQIAPLFADLKKPQTTETNPPAIFLLCLKEIDQHLDNYVKSHHS